MPAAAQPADEVPVVAHVGIGANLGDAAAAVDAAIARLAALPGCRLVARSSTWRTTPIDAGGPDYANAVAALATRLAPRALLDALQAIERDFGRERPYPNAPRTLDLDLLTWGDATVDEPGLVVPHPRMHLRAFVLAPLAEIAPDAVIPGHGPVGPLLSGCADQRIERLSPLSPLLPDQPSLARRPR